MERVININTDRLLYFDTDSIIFVKKDFDPEIETGDYLGQLTDEIKDAYGSEAKCKKFVSLGPKNYGYEVEICEQLKAIVKTKGIRTDGKTVDIINKASMLEMVMQYISGVPIEKLVEQWKIISHKHQHFVKSLDFKKLYRVVSEKRKIIGNDTLPFGYCN